MRLFLIRHGESEANVADCINDDPARPVNLTALGRTQAKTAAEALSRTRFTHCYASEFLRARQTAEILLGRYDFPLLIDARLNERRSGMDGLPVHAFNDLVHSAPLRAKPPRGESFLEQMHRVGNFLDEIAILHPDATVLAVSHENPILAARALLVDNPAEVLLGSIANCEWIELSWPKV